jgi:hypothetical protein
MAQFGTGAASGCFARATLPTDQLNLMLRIN